MAKYRSLKHSKTFGKMRSPFSTPSAAPSHKKVQFCECVGNSASLKAEEVDCESERLSGYSMSIRHLAPATGTRSDNGREDACEMTLVCESAK